MAASEPDRRHIQGAAVNGALHTFREYQDVRDSDAGAHLLGQVAPIFAHVDVGAVGLKLLELVAGLQDFYGAAENVFVVRLGSALGSGHTGSEARCLHLAGAGLDHLGNAGCQLAGLHLQLLKVVQVVKVVNDARHEWEAA